MIITICFLITLLILLILFLYIQNRKIVINNITYSNNKIPKSFEGFKILQISDLHNQEFGENQKNLINYTRMINPDIIVATGDIIDKRRCNYDNINIALSYFKEAVKIAPVYFVSGNHEISHKELYPKFLEKMIEIGVIDMNDKRISIKKDKESISLIGLSNISSILRIDTKNRLKRYKNKLNDLKGKTCNKFSILLSHRPDLIDVYANEKIDLVFCGHAHGGQVRLPFIGGLYAPNQGIFPSYTSGMHKVNNTSMIVNRGMGNSRFPFRIFNRPEMVVVTLKRTNNK